MSEAQAGAMALVRELLMRLGSLDASAMSDAERVDFLTAAERVKAALAAAQARVTVAFRRSSSQVMADLLVARFTGAEPGSGPVEVALVMTDAALLADDTTATIEQTQEPAALEATGSFPPPWPVTWSVTPSAAGSAGSGPAPPAVTWSRWTPDAASSPASCAGS